ncbi:hypothetical protein AS181_22985 [Gordonia sp. SGD-V-85]|nr:hypothetical protein AS181_22985 [Gordonia sp. SGD-V-85]MAU83016.1 hypothetical protein [Gordonia sp. (in: high G+C Gram-positive bacteria)]OUC76156.1 hypothetical protein CA982_23120 [Gordonia lacunae]
MSVHARAIAASIEQWRRACDLAGSVDAEHDAAAALVGLVEQAMPELARTEVVERSYLVRRVQRYVGPLPEQWAAMDDSGRDQYYCDHWLAVEEFDEHIDDDQLTLTIVKPAQ